MKRRGFLGLIGAALATPLMPTMGAAGAGYSRATYGMAVLHARTRHHVSARGLAHCLKVSTPQAKAMLGEMASSGLVKPITGGAGVHVRAVSNILQPTAAGLTQGAKAKRDRAGQQTQDPQTAPSNLNALMAHLHHMCVDNGITLHPRCAMQYGVAI